MKMQCLLNEQQFYLKWKGRKNVFVYDNHKKDWLNTRMTSLQ